MEIMEIIIFIVIVIVIVVKTFTNNNNLLKKAKTASFDELKDKIEKDGKINSYLTIILIVSIILPILIPLDLIVGIVYKLIGKDTTFAKALYKWNKLLLLVLCSIAISLGLCIFPLYY